MINQIKGVALITGASSGIGAVYAERLARRGYDLILVARREKQLRAVANKISDATGRKVETVVADLADAASSKRVEEILRSDDRISLLVNNAGAAALTPLLNSNVDKMSEMIELNVTALVRLTYAAVPGFVQRGAGTVINIASVVAIGPEVLNGVYGATKSFMIAFSQSLKHEVSAKGVRVQVVLPGITATDLWANAGMPVEKLPKEKVMQAETMVDAALAGLDLGEFVTAPALADIKKWDAFEQARQALIPILGGSVPADRYRGSATA